MTFTESVVHQGLPLLVTPAKAGVQFVYLIVFADIGAQHWIPACAGMTVQLVPQGLPLLVTPAKAGAQFVYLIVFTDTGGQHWIPAFAGMPVPDGCANQFWSASSATR